jgi:antitoxin CptB
MVGNISDDEALERRRKRLIFRSDHRGNKENDILLGQFAQAHLPGFDVGQLDRYEALLEESDNDIFDWMAGRADVPPEKDSDVLRLLLAFQVKF